MAPHVALSVGESKSFLLDLGSRLVDLQAGRYSISIVLYRNEQTAGWHSNAVSVDLHDLEERARNLMLRALPERFSAGRLPVGREWFDRGIEFRLL
jgi:hypothetical protein